jgi:CBS domain containing-hemolysin-like protein
MTGRDTGAMPDDQQSAARSDDSDSRSSGLFRKLTGMLFGGGAEPSLREQIEEVIDDAEEDRGARAASGPVGDMTPIERKMLRNLLQFGEQRVDDVAVPRSSIIALPETATFAEIVVLFAEAGHSRLPVYRDSLDEIIGMIHIKDVFAVLASQAVPPPLADLMRQPRYVPQSMRALDLLAEMRATRTHLAVVIDEYSGTEGLVTIEDLVEEIVGEIEDEHDDEPEALIVRRDDGSWDVDARAELDEIADTIAPALAETDDDVDTIGGLAAVLAGHVPATGEIVLHRSGWRLEIMAGDARRVDRLRLHPPVQIDYEAPLGRGEAE